MGIDMSKIRVGDEVSLRMAVTYVGKNTLVLDNRHVVPDKDIAEHHPKPREIEAGDEVRTIYDNKVRRVLYVHEGRAWLEGCGVYPVLNLQHVD